jgi:hypothetical protein
MIDIKEKEENGMAIDPKTVVAVAKQVSDVVLSEGGQKFLCGTYSDGKPRSMIDAMRDEYVSPKDRKKADKKKKKKKKNKKKGKHANADIFKF